MNVIREQEKNIEISVVIPLYKVENYMKKCVDSILNQTFKDFEIILVDDGSPDSCGVIADEYAENYPSIKVIHKENGGLSSARNAGMEIATGKYILFVDSDDWVEKQLLEKAYAIMEETDSEICIFNVMRINEIAQINYVQADNVERKINVESYGADNYIVNYLLNPKAHRYSAWNRMYKVDFIKSNNLLFEPNTEIHSEDMLFNLECSLYVKNVCSLNEPLYYHLIRSGTISTSPKPMISEKLSYLVENFIMKSQGADRYDLIAESIPTIVQYLFFMSVGSEINSNKKNISSLYKSIKMWSKKDFFRISMYKKSKEKISKRNFISFLLSRGFKGLSTVVLYMIIKYKARNYKI